MIELVMVFCLSGEPCAREVLAIFPQEEVGEALCHIAKPAIESAIVAKARKDATVTLSCDLSAEPRIPDYAPRQRDNRVTMADPGKVSPADVVMEIIEKVAN